MEDIYNLCDIIKSILDNYKDNIVNIMVLPNNTPKSVVIVVNTMIAAQMFKSKLEKKLDKTRYNVKGVFTEGLPLVIEIAIVP